MGTTALPLLALLFGVEHIQEIGREALDANRDPVRACVRYDGWHYNSIVVDGYDYTYGQKSTVAFFPGFPLLTRCVVWSTGMSSLHALLLVSNGFLALSFVLLAYYTRIRSHPADGSQVGWTLLAFGVWPATFFFRMAMAESLLVATLLLTLIGIASRWPIAVLSLVAGLATATRPVGVAATAAVLCHVLSDRPVPFLSRLRTVVFYAPLACWGLIAYMIYLSVSFGNPLAFAQTQEHWTSGAPVTHPTVAQKAWSLLTLEPVWGVYDPNSPRFCLSQDDSSLVFNHFFWNPLLFVFTVALVSGGVWRRALSGPEGILGFVLLAVPYLTRSYEMSMASHARFAAVVVVIYPLLGRVLASLPPPTACGLVTASAVMMSYWTVLYTAGYLLF